MFELSDYLNELHQRRATLLIDLRYLSKRQIAHRDVAERKAEVLAEVRALTDEIQDYAFNGGR